MKATNYQKQELKMYNCRFKEDITFKEAKEKLIKAKERAEKVKRSNKKWLKQNGFKGTEFFRRWAK